MFFFFSPLEQYQLKMIPFMPIIVFLLFAAVCALGYKDSEGFAPSKKGLSKQEFFVGRIFRAITASRNYV